MAEQRVFTDLIEAARAYAAPRGIVGGKGGWMRKNGKPLFIQGWVNFAHLLVARGVIDPQDGQGTSVARIPIRYGLKARVPREWSRDARQYTLTGKIAQDL